MAPPPDPPHDVRADPGRGVIPGSTSIVPFTMFWWLWRDIMPIARSKGAYQTVSCGTIVNGGTSVVDALVKKSNDMLTGVDPFADHGTVRIWTTISPIVPPACLRKSRRLLLP